jgi:hypothetical protein
MEKTGWMVAMVAVFGPVWLYLVIRLVSAAAFRSWVEAWRARGTGGAGPRKESDRDEKHG